MIPKHITRKVRTKTKCDILADEILSMIAQGVYKEGDKLPPENYFVENFGVSRVTVRESFKKLDSLGVVAIRQGEGTFVNRIGLDTMVKPLLSAVVLDKLNVNQIYDARLFVEVGNARLAARNRTDEELAELKEMVEQMSIARDKYNNDAFSELDAEFHEFIGRISRNYILLTMYTTVKDILHSYIKRTNLSREAVEGSLKHHIKIVRFIEERNEVAVGLAMEEHVGFAKQRLLEQLELAGK
jgi:GntR family transcriptional repressor for pyruvate dehydrogenase complex